ncbi:MAG: hypothetical protein U5M53_13025 [Rhodoferax sp.]|nr:hypothetical protein [Rhodoferax sp.]
MPPKCAQILNSSLFIRRWVPELAMKAAKDRMYGLRNTDQARAQAGEVQAKHGSRKSGLPNTTRTKHPKLKPAAPAAPSPQIDLFS